MNSRKKLSRETQERNVPEVGAGRKEGRSVEETSEGRVEMVELDVKKTRRLRSDREIRFGHLSSTSPASLPRPALLRLLWKPLRLAWGCGGNSRGGMMDALDAHAASRRLGQRRIVPTARVGRGCPRSRSRIRLAHRRSPNRLIARGMEDCEEDSGSFQLPRDS